MHVYLLVLFVHVLGAVGVFAAIAMESVALGLLRRANSSVEARARIGLLAFPAYRLGPLAMGATLVSGVGMMAMAWGRGPWMVAALAGLVAMAVLGGMVSGRRLRQLRAAVASETGSDLSDASRSLLSSDALTASLRLRFAIGVAILGLMTFKPEVAGSSVILAAGILAGLVASRVPLAIRRARPAEAHAVTIRRART